MGHKKVYLQYKLPFEIIDLDYADMEILNDPIFEQPQLPEHCQIIASSMQTDVGIGALITAPLSEVVKLGRDEDGLYLHVLTTEGQETYEIGDFRITAYQKP